VGQSQGGGKIKRNRNPVGLAQFKRIMMMKRRARVEFDIVVRVGKG